MVWRAAGTNGTTNPIARPQGEGVAMPAIATAGWIGFNPLVKEGLKQSCLIGPLAADQGMVKPAPSPVEIVKMKLPKARPVGIIPKDRPRQLLLLPQKVKRDLVGLLQIR